MSEKIENENGYSNGYSNENSNEFEKLLAEEGGLERLEKDSEIQKGALVEGTVIKITHEDIFLDIGIKTEGVIAVNEFDGALPQEGDTMKAIVSKRTPELVMLSFSKAKNITAWEELETAYENKLTISAKVTEAVNAGLVASISSTLRAFIPISQIDTIHVDEELAKTYVGKTFDFLIIQLSRSGKNSNIILSRKRLMADADQKKKREFIDTKKVGEIVKGVVKNHTAFGVFIDLGEIDGLLHISDISWSRNIDPKELLPQGTEVDLMITKLDEESQKINLSLKGLQENPWDSIHTKYKVDDTIKGEVVKLLPYGAFICLEEGIEGFVHISDMSWTQRITHPKEILKNDSIVECKILEINQENRRLSLGLKQVEENPWDSIDNTYPIGLKTTAKIEKIFAAGLLVVVGEYLKGFISKDDYSWSKKQRTQFSEHQEVACKVIGHDKKTHEIKLGIKQLEENPWDTGVLQVGTVVEGTITNVADFGVFVKISDEIEGLIPKSQAYDMNEIASYEDAKHLFKKGNTIQAIIKSVDTKEQKISLSVRELKDMANKQEIEKHLVGYDEDEPHNIHLGDILNSNDKDSDNDKGNDNE